MLKLTLKFASKCSYMFRLNKKSSGSLLLCFPEVIIPKKVKNVVQNQFGRVAAYLPFLIGMCTVQSAMFF